MVCVDGEAINAMMVFLSDRKRRGCRREGEDWEGDREAGGTDGRTERDGDRHNWTVCCTHVPI